MKAPQPSPNTPAAEQAYGRPVAYDANGRPLYAHPPVSVPPTDDGPSLVANTPEAYHGESFDPHLRKQYAAEPGVVHASREIEPARRPLSDELQRLHDESQRRYPFLNLSKGEHVIIAVRRHPIGLFAPVAVAGTLIVILLALLLSYPLLMRDGYLIGLPSFELIVGPVLLMIALVALGGYIAIWVYLQNKFFMTNESVIQEIQHSLFARHEQTVSLGSIEDASFIQSGIIQSMFNYGTIRLSTEGEETTYRFQYVTNPKHQIAVLNNAVEAFKNGRPVEAEPED